MIVPLVVGFTLSSTAVFAAVWYVGSLVRSLAPAPLDYALPVALASCVLADLTFPRLRCSVARRQTPQHLVGTFPPALGAFLWGLDTGSVFSTFRASAASLAAVVLVSAGWTSPWAGLLYAAGFCIPLLTMICTNGIAGATRRFRSVAAVEPELAIARISNAASKVRLTSAALAAAAAVRAVAEIVLR